MVVVNILLGGCRTMKVGKYQIGRYHAIIKTTYEDGTFDYETSFTDKEDIEYSYFCIKQCIGRLVGTANSNPKVLMGVSIIRGNEEIIKELEGK